MFTANQPERRSTATNTRTGKTMKSRSCGFTMLELMVVITIMLILITLGAGRYEKSVLVAKETALRQDLVVMRNAIDQYTLDKQQAPQSLDDLVTAGYLREVPLDPVTRSKDWRTESSDTLLSPEQSSGGI